MKIASWILCLSALSATVACKKTDSLAGFDKDALFEPATAAEINSVQDMWAQRDLSPHDVRIEESYMISSSLSVHIISFTLSGSKEYAGVLIPVSDHPLPVQVYVGGYPTAQDAVNSVHFQLSDETPPYIFVVPSLRGQYMSLQVGETKYESPLSEGSRFNAFDGAADDVIASLTAVAALFSQADTSRAMIRGGSRGGIVAMLAGERDKRFKRVAAVAFNVEFIGLTSQLYNDPIYKEQFLAGLINGTSTIAETRRLLIASSPLYFCDQLPETQLHCAQNDRITPASQGQLLFDRMNGIGMGSSVALFIYPGRDHTNIAEGNAELNSRINSFFGELW